MITFRKFVFGGLAAALIAVAGIGAVSQPAEAGVRVNIGVPGVFGYWAPRYYPGYYAPYPAYQAYYPAYPAYYGGYYGAPRYYGYRGNRNYYYNNRYGQKYHRYGRYNNNYYRNNHNRYRR